MLINPSSRFEKAYPFTMIFAFSAIFSSADGLSSPSGDARKQRQEDPCSKTDALEHGHALFLMNEALLYQ